MDNWGSDLSADEIRLWELLNTIVKTEAEAAELERLRKSVAAARVKAVEGK